MYNTQPYISTQEVSISVKNGDERIVIVSCRQEVVWEMALVAGSSSVAVTNG